MGKAGEGTKPPPDARPARNLRSRPMGRYPGLRFEVRRLPMRFADDRVNPHSGLVAHPVVAYRCGGSTGIAL